MQWERQVQLADGAHHCDLPCRWCGGSRIWTPEKPHAEESGAIIFVRVAEECVMCLGTGECMHVHPDERMGGSGSSRM